MILNFWHVNTFIDLNPENSLYIDSLSEPFNEEMKLLHERMHNWLDYFDLQFIKAHCSDHMCGSDLKGLIDRIRPKTLFPIHTEYISMFRSLLPRTRMIQTEKCIRFKSLKDSFDIIIFKTLSD